MEIAEILEKLEILTDSTNPNGIYFLGKDRAFKATKFYELDIMRKSILSTIQKQYNDLSAAKSEIEARSHEKYINHLTKMIAAKLNEELAICEHEQARLSYQYLDRRLSIVQSQMKQR